MVPALPDGASAGVDSLSELLEVIAHGVTAILATWLGLLVVTRARRAPGAPIFGVLCLCLLTWSVAIIVQRTSLDDGVHAPLNFLEDASAFFLPATTTHIAVLVAFEGHRSRPASAVILAGYALALLGTAQAALLPGEPIQFGVPNWAPFGVPGDVVAWGFALARLAIWLAGIGYLGRALLQAGNDRARRRQLGVALATVVLGVLGGMLRILPEEIGGPPAIGVSIVALATVMATYAILAQNIFIAPAVAERAVRWSLVGGLAIVAYVGTLVVLEGLAARLLAIDFPLVTALAVVVTLALFEPVADRVRSGAAGGRRDAANELLLRALGTDPVLGQAPDRAMAPALDRLVRTFGLSGAEVVIDGEVRAASGSLDPDDPLSVRLPLRGERGAFGHVRFGSRRNGLSFTGAELTALEQAVAYLAAAHRLADRHREQAEALVELRTEREVVESQGSALHQALADAAAAPSGLRVYALGPLRAELDGQPMRRWGGEKAGSRQAEAIFAFLFDRGERGVAKEEIVELIWPDVDLEKADVAFHRTMLGLRAALQPGRRGRRRTGPIVFGNDRYRLEPGVVAWSDVAAFEELLSEAGAQTDPDDALRLYEAARALYRAEYLDDCPYYGDGAAVEDRRNELRNRYVDLLVELGGRYAARGDRTAARSCYRQAQALAEDELPTVTDALRRLTMPVPAEPA